MSFPKVQQGLKEPLEWCRRLTDAVNSLRDGKTNNTGSVTLTASSTSTTVNVSSGMIGENTVVLFSAKTANAASAISGMYYATDPANNRFTITHASTADADKTFDYVIVG